MNPINLLPIKRPLEDDNPPDGLYFYNNVIQHLIPDIIKLESNGIPINLDKVQNLQNTVDSVLDNVKNRLASNKIMLDFLTYKNKLIKQDKVKELKTKEKTIDDFIKPFNIKNKIHFSYVINQYLIDNNKEDMCLEEWTKKDLKKLNQIIASKFLNDLLNNDIKNYMYSIINKAMYKLAENKVKLYNKTKINTKIELLEESKLIDKFNPGSSVQKQEFFKFYDIESSKETKKGNPQWDRDTLEELQKLLEIMIGDK